MIETVSSYGDVRWVDSTLRELLDITHPGVYNYGVEPPESERERTMASKPVYIVIASTGERYVIGIPEKSRVTAPSTAVTTADTAVTAR